MSALFDAAKRGDVAAATQLLDQGATVDEMVLYFTDHWTALHVAALHGDVPMLRLLLDRGAQPDLVSPRSRHTPLFLAVSVSDALL